MSLKWKSPSGEKASLVVVGLGASAGGLAAYRTFLEKDGRRTAAWRLSRSSTLIRNTKARPRHCSGDARVCRLSLLPMAS